MSSEKGVCLLRSVLAKWYCGDRDLFLQSPIGLSRLLSGQSFNVSIRVFLLPLSEGEVVLFLVQLRQIMALGSSSKSTQYERLNI